MRDIFGITDYTIVQALADAGCAAEQIDHVIVSHLHFDHAGGLTRKSNDGTGVDLTFPNAQRHHSEAGMAQCAGE